jgi:para-nitrobenzyl esterase
MKAFLGIPYAAAPVGENRFRPPRRALPWQSGRPADHYGPTAPKGDYPAFARAILPEVTIAGDDYLNLNIWTPDPHARGLPVLVWLHGGSFVQGSGSLPEYDGSAFARDGIVCVTLNYRLGIEGFLCLDDSTANLGLLDIVEALTWLEDNVSAFGGDPSRITLAGESAGAMAIAALLAMPAAQGLFHAAILQSGAANSVLNAEEAAAVTARVAGEMGVAPTRDAMTAVPVERCVAVGSSLVWRNSQAKLPLAPVVDPETLPLPPLAALARGAAHNIPCLVGTTRDEARLFTVPSGLMDAADDAVLTATATRYGLGLEGLAEYSRRYPAASAGELLNIVMTDGQFRVPVLELATAHQGPTWVYRWDGVSPEDNKGLGSCHAAEVPFVFGNQDLPMLRPRLGACPSPTVGRTIHDAWVEFVCGDGPGWPQWGKKHTSAILADGLTVVNNLDAATVQVWRAGGGQPLSRPWA